MFSIHWLCLAKHLFANLAAWLCTDIIYLIFICTAQLAPRFTIQTLYSICVRNALVHSLRLFICVIHHKLWHNTRFDFFKKPAHFGIHCPICHRWSISSYIHRNNLNTDWRWGNLVKLAVLYPLHFICDVVNPRWVYRVLRGLVNVDI